MVESYSDAMIKLTTTNYSLWKSMMENLLNCKDLYDHIGGDNAKSSNISYVDWKKLKKKTLGAILVGRHQSLQSCCQRDRSPHSLEELEKHV